MIFSLVLLAPSWGGMINGVMTLSGAWHKLRDDPILKFLIVALSFYGMATFEGPMMSIKTVNALSHYTDWTIGHVHAGALGWVAMISIGALYHMIACSARPACTASSDRAALLDPTLGIVLYIAAMWIAGVMQRLCGGVNADGMVYTFVEASRRLPFYDPARRRPLYLGGMRWWSGNVVMTARAGRSAARGPAAPYDREGRRARACQTAGPTPRTIETNVSVDQCWLVVVIAIGGWSKIVPQHFSARPPGRAS
jgi:cytochrome c oxidase cbb3-type subunit 1